MEISYSQYQVTLQRVSELENIVSVQAKEINVLKKQNKDFKQELEFLKKENKRLLGELRKFLNENTPSGSIPPFLKPSVREETQQARKNELKESKEPNPRNSRPKEFDKQRDIVLKKCPRCGGTRLTEKKKKYQRITLGVIFPLIEKILNIIHTYYCLDCKKEVVPSLPDALPNSKFDLNTAILISVLFTGFNLSERKIVELFSTIFGLDISVGSISNCLKRLKEYLEDDYKKLEQEIMNATHVYRDGSSWRKNGELNWVHVASTAKTVLFKITKNYDSKTAKSLKLRKDCVQITDGHKIYNDTCKEQQRDWAHLSRVAEKPKHYFKNNDEKEEYESIVEKLMKLFSDGKKDKISLGCSKELRKQYDEKLFELLGEPRKRDKLLIGKNVQRLKTYILNQKKFWFTFIEFPEVDPTSNRAERDIRHLVLKRKISQQNRSDDHMESYEMQASIYMTSKYREQNYFQTLQNIMTEQIKGKI